VEIPDAIEKLQSLTNLDLYNNRIVEIPDAIEKLQSLTRLNLSNNKIVEVMLPIRTAHFSFIREDSPQLLSLLRGDDSQPRVFDMDSIQDQVPSMGPLY
jgi:Leucine-rich repeat (LRR) protein